MTILSYTTHTHLDAKDFYFWHILNVEVIFMSKRMLATLTAEHLAILETADKLRNNIEKLKVDEDLTGVKEGLYQFNRVMDQTLSQHCVQEEEELFPKLLKSNPGLNGEVDSLLEDHRVLREAHRNLQEELMGDKPSPQLIVESCTSLLDRLEAHFHREHQALASLNASKK